MQRFEMRLSDEMAEKIDRARGETPRATWIKRLLAERLAEPGPLNVQAHPVVIERPPAVAGNFSVTGSTRGIVTRTKDPADPPAICPECSGIGTHELECSRRPGFDG